MTSIPQCFRCKHYDADAPRGTFRCAAFSEGIPREILFNEFDHTKPHAGDGGIRFEPIGPSVDGGDDEPAEDEEAHDDE